MRLTIPCRALTCSHLQCFDATLYIQMNEKKPTWVCPVCDKKAPYEHLIIDGYVNLKFFLASQSNHLLLVLLSIRFGIKILQVVFSELHIFKSFMTVEISIFLNKYLILWTFFLFNMSSYFENVCLTVSASWHLPF